MQATDLGQVRWIALVPMLLGEGCSFTPATVMIDGVAVPRQQHRLEGNPYAIRHYDAHPKPDSVTTGKVEGGRISGVVCGSDIEYSIDHTATDTRLSGTIDNQHQSQLKVLSTKDVHGVVGNVGPKEVRLEFSREHIEGYIGRCPYHLELDKATPGNDTLVEYISGRGQKMRIEIYGVQSLWQMPAADQAAVLPMVLLCMTAKMFDNLGRESIPPYGFGGRLGAVPSGTIQLGGSVHNTDCGAREYK